LRVCIAALLRASVRDPANALTPEAFQPLPTKPFVLCADFLNFMKLAAYALWAFALLAVGRVDLCSGARDILQESNSFSYEKYAEVRVACFTTFLYLVEGYESHSRNSYIL
jgi:hypothetical protein